MTWKQQRDERVMAQARPHLETLERHGYRFVSLHWWRLRGHQLLLADPAGVTEYHPADTLGELAAGVEEQSNG